MRRRLFFAIVFSVITLLPLALFPQSAESTSHPIPSPSLASLPLLATYTVHLPVIMRSPPVCAAVVNNFVLQSGDMPGYNFDFDKSGAIDLSPDMVRMGAIAGCNAIYRGEWFSATPLVENVVILFRDSVGAKDYFEYRYQELLTLTNTHPIESPLIGDVSAAFQLTAGIATGYAVEFQKGKLAGGVYTAGWTGLVPFTDALKYARIVEAKLPD